MANERIGEQLVKNALITPEQLLEAQKAQKVSGTRLGSQLVKLGHISEEQLVEFLGASTQHLEVLVERAAAPAARTRYQGDTERISLALLEVDARVVANVLA